VVKFRARRADGTWVYKDETVALAAFWREAKAGLLTAVGQYTGLHDREGHPVYEGDICQYRKDDTGAPYEETGVIPWASGCFAFGNTPLCELTFTNDRLPLTVIGNDVEHAEILATGAGYPDGLSRECATPC